MAAPIDAKMTAWTALIQGQSCRVARVGQIQQASGRVSGPLEAGLRVRLDIALVPTGSRGAHRRKRTAGSRAATTRYPCRRWHPD
jgi:hypothetical protein